MNSTPNLDLIRDQLGEHPVLLEINPPPTDQIADHFQQHQQTVESLLGDPLIQGINLPEIQEEEKKGEKGERKSEFKQRVPPREYAGKLRDIGDVFFIVNRVIVQLPPRKQEDWLIETHRDYGINSVVLVGGESSEIDYPGPSVPEGNRLIKNYLNQGRRQHGPGTIDGTNFLIGNICIPTRRRDDFDEPERMLKKIHSGCDFFTTQILGEAESGTRLLHDLTEVLDDSNTQAPGIFWSFTPIAQQKDVNFLRWLGVEIPDETEQRILGSDDPVGTSIDWIHSLWKKLLETQKKLGFNGPMGINVCPLALRNYDHAVRFIQSFEDEFSD